LVVSEMLVFETDANLPVEACGNSDCSRKCYFIKSPPSLITLGFGTEISRWFLMAVFKFSILTILLWSIGTFALTDKSCTSFLKSQNETVAHKVEEADIAQNVSSKSLQKQVELKIGKKIRLKVKVTYNTFIQIFDTKGKELAWADFYLAEGNIVKIVNISVDPPYQKTGISKLIIAKIVELVPEVVGLWTSYVQDNERVLNQFLDSGYNISDAIKQTPTYKSIAAIGFTEFQEIRYSEKDKYLFDYTARKPQSH